MRIQFVLPGAHRVQRGAEVAFEAIAHEIGLLGKDQVTMLGSGDPIPGRSYGYRRFPAIRRERFERFPKVPPFRSEYVFEEFSWLLGAARHMRGDADVTVTCSYPFVNWALTRSVYKRRPPHVFVTQNGDWPSYSDASEYALFRCDGLVCTNPLYFDRNRARTMSALIPNGVHTDRFLGASPDRKRWDLPEDRQIVLVVSALVDDKRVLEAVRSISTIPDIMLVVAGDGPLRSRFDELAHHLMPDRVRRLSLQSADMPVLYKSADVLLHPTTWESFGNVYVEAMISGLPVVAHDYEVTRWIFGNSTELIDATDESMMANAVARALERGKSDAADLVSEAAVRFSWTAIARQYREFLSEVVGHSRSNQS